MTDNEIIKALECCILSKHICPKNCPLANDRGCMVKVKENALDLINRQKAELDDLKRDDLPRCKDALRRANEMGMALEKENSMLIAEIEMLNNHIADVGKKVVFCKECQYSETATDPIAGIEFRVCQWYPYTHRVKDTHYCGYGERKGDNNVQV